MIILLLLIMCIVSMITWFSCHSISEDLRIEVERLTDEVDDLRNQLRSQKIAVNQSHGER
jgi:Tfp pilus assembly protein PilO